MMPRSEAPAVAVPGWFQKYLDRGFRLISYPTKTKGPIIKRWPDKASSSVDAYVLDSNFGVLLGVEIAPGKFLADVDFDWTPGLQLAPAMLPATEFGFGRASKNISHAFYTTPEPATTRQFRDVDKTVLVELRGVTENGALGFQTMVPPSIHPSGEDVEFRNDGEIGHVDDLQRSVTLFAVACILAKHLGHHGFGHDTRLAFAGFLLRDCGLSGAEVIKVGNAIAQTAGNDTNGKDVTETVHSTATRLRNGNTVSGERALAAALGDDGIKVLTLIKEWVGAAVYVRNSRGPIPDHYGNVQHALATLGAQLSYNEFTQEAQVTWRGQTTILDEPVRNRLWFAIERECGFRPSAGYFDTFLQDAARDHTFHPVRDYLDAQSWDGTPRIDTWLSVYGGAADNDYTRAVSALLLLALVRRVRQPGCKFDEMPVLESEQGLGKSTALVTLCPNDDWFSDNLPLNVDAKQIIEGTLGKWIIEASDLHGYGAADVEHLKAMLSRRVDGPVRMAYARMPTARPRHFVVVGTTNSHVYLKDATGNRRFWPVRVKGFDLVGLRAVRDQLWAEAAAREAAGESIRLSPDLYPLAALQQERRRQIDPWEATLDAAFPRDVKHRLSWDDIYGAVGIAVDKRDPRAHARLVKVLQGLGFASMPVKREGKSVRGMGRDAEEGSAGELWEV